MIYFGQFNNPKVDEYLHNTFFKNQNSGFFIECGAYDGIIDSSCLFFEKILGWQGINIESDPDMYKLLQKNRPNSKNLHLALANQENSNKLLQFQRTRSRLDNSIVGHGFIESITPDIYKNLPEKNLVSVKSTLYPVLATSIKDLVIAYNISSIDLLVLDVEGAEEAILKDLCLSPALPKILCIEDNLGYRELLDNILLPLGYEFISKIHVNLHYKLN